VTTTEQLCQLFSEVLGISDVEADDDFFDLGGDSFKAAQLARRITAALEVKVPIKRIYDLKTATDIAKFVEEKKGL
jgi:acyl carrier protein